MATFERNILLSLKRRYTQNEQYNLLLTAYTNLERESKADTENLRLLRKEYQELEKETISLRKLVADKGVVSSKVYSTLVKKHRDLEDKYYDLVRHKNNAEQEKMNKELEDLRL
ncbi:MAG TPA: hypothetical protein VGM30_10475 [Puia sp.]|jgi:hypothetical protein